MSKAADFDKEFAEMIIRQIQAGTAPWQQDWVETGFRLPFNVVSKKPYRGLNILRLFMAGYSDPRWATYKQAQDKGWQVKKGEKSTRITFWKPVTKDGTEAVETEDGEPNFTGRWVHNMYCVFNAAQMDGVEALPTSYQWDIAEIGEKIIEHCISKGAKIEYGHSYPAHTSSLQE